MDKTTNFYSKGIKAIKIVAVLVFLWIVFEEQDLFKKIDFQAVTVHHPWLIVAVILLLPFNLFFEFLKWKSILKELQIYELKKGVQSFLSGIFSGFITPDFIGNFVGRILYFPFKVRPKIILYTLLSNYSQFMTTITVGGIILTLIPEKIAVIPRNYHGLVYIVIAFTWGMYYFFEKFRFSRFHWLSYFRFFEQDIRLFTLKNKFVLFNLLRYGVFSIQYLLILNAFEVEFHTEFYNFIVLTFLWITLLPNFILGKFFLRESVAIVVFMPVIENGSVVLLASLMLAFINQIFPALIGIPFLVKKKKYE